MMGYWAQGDCIWFPEAMDAMEAISDYRHAMTMAEIAVQTTRPDGVLVKELRRECDALTTALAAAREQLVELEEHVEARNRVLNYWWPALGYRSANEMVYPAVEDRRAEEAPALVRLSALVAAGDALELAVAAFDGAKDDDGAMMAWSEVVHRAIAWRVARKGDGG